MMTTVSAQKVKTMRDKVAAVWARLRLVFSQRLAKVTIVALYFAWLLTGLGLVLGLFKSDDPLIVALFQNWMSDVIFFTVVSAALALFSSLPSELETFERRAGILFRGKSGSYVDFAQEQLRALGNYSERTDTRIEVYDSDENDEWMRLTTTSTLSLRNLVEDLVTEIEFPVSDPEQENNPARRSFRILTFSVDGERQVPQRTAADGRHFYRLSLTADRARQVEMTTESWVRDAENVAHTPLRFTAALAVNIVNRCARQITVVRKVPVLDPPLKLPPKGNEPMPVFPPIENARPHRMAYKFRITRTRRARQGLERPVAQTKGVQETPAAK